jgi:hypothetical protein
MATKELTVHLKKPHPKQVDFIDSTCKRKCVRAGRRGGKTVGVSIYSVERFLKGRRILYACPTLDQVNTFWREVKKALAEPIAAGVYYKNETEKIIELPGTEQRIKAKTAHDADSLRGDYADDLILDEYQDMDPKAWSEVGAPMLLDNNGDAIFIFTSKIGLKHIKALVQRCKDQPERWRLFSFSSYDNPYLPKEAIDDLAGDMTSLAYRMEILAEEVEDDPAALWNRAMIDHVTRYPELYRVVVAVDPPGGATEAGIIVAGAAYVGGQDHIYVQADYSAQMGAAEWAAKVVSAYYEWEADAVVAEVNFGGDMVANTIQTIDPRVPVEIVRATRGKAVRAEPVVALYQNHAGLHRVHHVGDLPGLEDEMCQWVPGQGPSPNRVDALVWAGFSLVVDKVAEAEEGESPVAGYRG